MDGKVSRNGVIIAEMQKLVKTTYDLASSDHSQISQLQQVKVETKDFMAKMEDILE